MLLVRSTKKGIKLIIHRFFFAVEEDYHNPQMLQLTLNFTTNVQINIPIINDEVFELTESFFVNLSLVGGSTSQNSTKVIILDDEGTVNIKQSIQ